VPTKTGRVGRCEQSLKFKLQGSFLNYLRSRHGEMTPRNQPPHFGAWCQGNSGNTLAYVSFLPNLMHNTAGIALNVSIWAFHRAHWAVMPWMESVIAAVATASVIRGPTGQMARKGQLVVCARGQRALYRLRYEMPEQITLDNVAAISREFQEQRGKLSDPMAAIHAGPPKSSNKQPGV